MVKTGDRRRLSLPEIRKAALSLLGWQQYFMVRDQIDARLMERGITWSSAITTTGRSKAPDLRAIWDEFTSALTLAYPDWAADRLAEKDRGQKMRDILSLATMSSNPSLSNLDAIQGLRKYFAARTHYIDRLRARGVKTLDSQKGFGVKRAWQATVRDILGEHPFFARIWGRYLERDELMPLKEMARTLGWRREATPAPQGEEVEEEHRARVAADRPYHPDVQALASGAPRSDTRSPPASRARRSNRR